MKLINICHKNLKQNELVDAIRTKQTAWPYALDKQRDWINENIHGNDVHCFLKEESETVAYMNLVDESIFLDKVQYPMWGVGNVCSAVRGKGYGKVLMEMVNDYITSSGRIGLLICHDNLVPFYTKHKWREIKDCVTTSTILVGNDCHFMIFNCLIPFKNVQYNGRNF